MSDGWRTGFVHQTGIELERAIPGAAEIGCDFIEIIMDGPTERRSLAAEQERIRSLLDDAGIDLLFHFPWALDIGSPLEHVQRGAIKELEACIDTAAAFQAEKAVIHASSEAWSAWDYEPIQDNILTAITELARYGDDNDVEICVENIPGGFFDTLDFDRFFTETEAVMTFDTGHARMDGMDAREMAAFIREYRNRISHLHLNDVMVGEIEHVPFGSGTLDFGTILEPLRDDWTGTMSLEPFTYAWDYITYSKEQLDELL